ncbi:hypothetical protein ACFE04_010780 [Oxalis oulophora]
MTIKKIMHFKNVNLNESPSTMAETSRARNAKDDEVILVSAKEEEEEEEEEPLGEFELLFFEELDFEYKKVVDFYKEKVGEILNEAEDLNKQMDALIALRLKVENPVIPQTASTEVEISAETSVDIEIQEEDDKEKKIDEKAEKGHSHRGKIIEINGFRPASLTVLNRIKISTDPLTPISTITIRAILPRSDYKLSFSHLELNKAEKRITQAFVEFHYRLRLLKRYRFLNQLAFSKIMKKYDKVTSRNESKAYMQMVDDSDLGSSDLVWIHRSAYAHVCWRHLLLEALAVLTLSGVVANLNFEMDPDTQSYKALTELVPLAILTALLLIIFCPFNIIYRSSRVFLIRSAFHCIATPFYKVNLPDFFLADQVTSQVQALRNLEFYVCYYVWGDFAKRSNTCAGNNVYKTFNYLVAIIPYWIRFIQSMRRMVEEKDGMHGLSGLKYLSTIVAVAMRTAFDQNKGKTMKILVAITSGLATIANTYWDIVIDWGLLRKDSKNRWLRDKLVIPHQSIYFVAMALNVVLRLAWMQSVLGISKFRGLHTQALAAIVACLEIIRRGIWNFFRLENEHLNNVGKYRVYKSVPLPFNYDNEDKRL